MKMYLKVAKLVEDVLLFKVRRFGSASGSFQHKGFYASLVSG